MLRMNRPKLKSVFECRARRTLTVRLVASRSCRSLLCSTPMSTRAIVASSTSPLLDRRHLRHLLACLRYLITQVAQPALKPNLFLQYREFTSQQLEFAPQDIDVLLQGQAQVAQPALNSELFPQRRKLAPQQFDFTLQGTVFPL